MSLQLNLLIFSIFALNCVQGFNVTQHNNLYDVISSAASIVSIAENIVNNREKTVSLECREDLQDFLSSLDQKWPLQMIDSAGKIPHGIMKLNLKHMGQHGECIEISNKKPSGRVMRGQHCMLQIAVKSIKPERQEKILQRGLMLEKGLENAGMIPRGLIRRFEEIERDEENNLDLLDSFMIALCFPSSCKASDINNFFTPIVIGETIKVNFGLIEPSCTTEKTIELTPGDIGTITFLSLIGFLMLCSTIYDIWFQKIKGGKKEDQKPLYVAFSVFTNSKRLFTPSKNPGPLACLNGIRALSILWVVLGHRYVFGFQGAYENFADAVEWSQTVGATILVSGTVSVDSFFLLSGILVSYTFFRSAKLQNIARELPIFYIHRIIRLTPLLVVVILLSTTLWTHYGNGPFAFLLDEILFNGCKDNWWLTLLYVQNYVKEPICIGQSWYLAVDMHLYILSPLLLYPLLWNKRFGLIWVWIWIVAAQATTFSIAFVNKYFGGFLLQTQDITFLHSFYFPTHTRAVPYLIGIMAGYLICQSFKENKITTIQYNFLKTSLLKQALIIFGWLCSLAILAAVIFGSHSINQFDHLKHFSHWQDTMYAAFSRTAWAVGLLWIIVACGYGYGGPINWFLSLRVWEILARFSYAIYLTHMSLIYMLIFTENHVKLFTHTHMLIDFFGDVFISLVVSYVLILGFESPIAILEKMLFKKDKKEEPSPILPEFQKQVLAIEDLKKAEVS